jgi:hypothetical protein
MIWQRDRDKITNYPPETLKTFRVMMYEWIDNLCFTIDPKECLPNAEEYMAKNTIFNVVITNSAIH